MNDAPGKKISYEQWCQRICATSPQDGRFLLRDDDPTRTERLPDAEYFGGTHISVFRLTTPTEEEVWRAGHVELVQGFCYARISRVWARDQGARPLCCSLVFAIEIARVPQFNTNSDASLDVAWRCFIANGLQPEVIGPAPLPPIAVRESWWR